MTTVPGPVTSLDLDQHLATAGALAASFQDASDRIWRQPYIAAGLLELVRLRLARLHDAEAELKVRQPAALVGSLPEAKVDRVMTGDWGKDSAFSTTERAVLDFADYYYVDPQSIADDCAQAVLAEVGEPGLVCLVEALGFIDSRIRLALIYSRLVRHH